MNNPEIHNARRRNIAYAIIAAHAGLTIKQAELKRATERENDARRLRLKVGSQLAELRKTSEILESMYAEQCSELGTMIAEGATPPTPLPLSTGTPGNAYTDPNYPPTYEGYTTMETFSIAHIIDNTPALLGDLELRWTLCTGIPSMLTQVDQYGYAKAAAIDIYGPLIMAAMEELRRMHEPIELRRVDLDDLIRSWHSRMLDYHEERKR